jgi:hypothetical protein
LEDRELLREDEMRESATEDQRPSLGSSDEAALAIVHDCERAIRRLDTLIGERNDVLLVQARRSVRRAASRAAELGRARPHAA